MSATSEQQKLQHKDELALESLHSGFRVCHIEDVPEISAVAYQFVHEASGARALWLSSADNNKSFAIAFKTPPCDDTGVFHILEHSVLCGSKRYPVKEPFVNLLKSSMQTFLNALTFPDKTMYPVASTNDVDLENLMSVYLDAVFSPNIYTNPHIFEQEGWHYELSEDESKLSYNGVVFNEMKGALSDPDDTLMNATMRALFPDTAYGCESGGNPRAIPSLSYEQFIDTHRRHYKLSNSYSILYGEIDIEEKLAFLNERFEELGKSDAGDANPLLEQAAVTPGLIKQEMASSPDNACVSLSYVLGTMPARERILAVDILFDALAGSNEAPLKRAILESGYGDDLLLYLMDDALQPYLFCELKGAKADVAEKFRALFEESCKKLIREGIPRDKLEASLSRAEFVLREEDTGTYPNGVVYAMRVMSSWLYDDNRACDSLHFEEAFEHMRAGLNSGYFEKLLKELVIESKHNALVELVPVEEGDAQEEERELAEKLAAMNESERKDVQEALVALREMQEAADSPEALQTLPVLSLDEVGDAPTLPTMKLDEKRQLFIHDADTHGITHVSYYFDLSCLRFEELSTVSVLSGLLAKLDTKQMSASELDTALTSKLGRLNFSPVVFSNEDPDFAPVYLKVSASALSSNLEDLVELPAQVWEETLFSDADKIKNILLQQKLGYEQQFLNSGHAAAIARLRSYFTKAGLVSEQLSGVDSYLFIKELLANWDSRTSELTNALEDICHRIFAAKRYISITASAEDRERFLELLAAQEGGEIRVQNTEIALLELPSPSVKNEAFMVPSNVCYVGSSSTLREAELTRRGIWTILGRALSYDYLWNEVRVKGGAYGTGFRHNNGTQQLFWSYRDPNLDQSLERYHAAASWLKSWEPDEDEFRGYIIASVAEQDEPKKPRALSALQDTLYFCERPESWLSDMREQLLAATLDEVRSLSTELEEAASDTATCVFGSADIIESANTELNKVALIG